VADTLNAARVRVPCSTSNLGSGYDTIGLALNRYLEASFEPGPTGLKIFREGSLARAEYDDADDLVARSFASALRSMSLEVGGTLRLTSDIPIGKGLGSSAAAILAGSDLALAAGGRGRDDAGVFGTAYEHEGHGDNLAPCLYGGLRAVLPGATGPLPIELALSADLGFAYAAPAAAIETKDARSALPELVGHDLAARSLARATALVRGLASADRELIKIGVEDELHVPHRLPMIPGAYNAIGAGYDAGAWAITISGAGSGLIALCDPSDSEEVAEAMRQVFCNGTDDPDCPGFAATPDFEGLTRLSV
jgi:homoserine kinase|tara:strand:+ start:388 stop:1311 length:924 start_codon:yes stop_codon:yes gene_type:complete